MGGDMDGGDIGGGDIDGGATGAGHAAGALDAGSDVSFRRPKIAVKPPSLGAGAGGGGGDDGAGAGSETRRAFGGSIINVALSSSPDSSGAGAADDAAGAPSSILPKMRVKSPAVRGGGAGRCTSLGVEG